MGRSEPWPSPFRSRRNCTRSDRHPNSFDLAARHVPPPNNKQFGRLAALVKANSAEEKARVWLGRQPKPSRAVRPLEGAHDCITRLRAQLQRSCPAIERLIQTRNSTAAGPMKISGQSDRADGCSSAGQVNRLEQRW